jgi:hypothetical protein
MTNVRLPLAVSKRFLLLALVLPLAFALTCGDESESNDARPTDPSNATFVIEGRTITLTNGISEIEAAPGSASKITTRYFGNEARGDLNGDGLADVGFLVTQNAGGSGTFYYAVVTLQLKNGYEGTNAVLLGDRIAPQTTELRNGELTVNFADRRPGEPMTTPPSVGVSKYFKVVSGSLVERN